MRRALELADVVREHAPAFLAGRGECVSSAGTRVLSAIKACRTAALGGHLDRCDDCGHEAVSYNSCRNRHCPKCQVSATTEWTERQEQDLLPVEYFHVVFTLPAELAAVALHNKRRVYGLMFRVVAKTLQQIARDPKHLGAEIGLLAVLHTWGQNLHHHPHIHCIVPGGGLAADGEHWLSCRTGFFVPVRVLSRLFRGKLLAELKRLHEKGKLRFGGQVQGLSDRQAFRDYLAPLYRKDWVVYAKPPFGGPSRVLKYLARYTHRVAISNSRLVSMDDHGVSFTWRDYAHGNRKRLMSLSVVEFLRRFLLHVLPKGLKRIRSYGLLANRHRRRKLQECRSLIGARTEQAQTEGPVEGERIGARDRRCPECKLGRMVIVLAFEAGMAPRRVQWSDTS